MLLLAQSSFFLRTGLLIALLDQGLCILRAEPNPCVQPACAGACTWPCTCWSEEEDGHVGGSKVRCLVWLVFRDLVFRRRRSRRGHKQGLSHVKACSKIHLGAYIDKESGITESRVWS